MKSIEPFRAEMGKKGLLFNGQLLADGHLHRFKADGDRRPNSWYVLHAGPPAAGAYGCWKRDLKDTWCEKSGENFSDAEWQSILERWELANRERQRIESRIHEKARKTAKRIFSRSSPASHNHRYLVQKGLSAFGDLREWHGSLVIPLRDLDGVLHSLQFINPDGKKRFLRGGRIAGCSFPLAEDFSRRVLLAEGYATGVSVHKATGDPVYCAMSCGNLLAVARELRSKWPDREIIVVADNDQFTPGNPGLTRGKEAAAAIHARLAVPHFTDLRTKPTDFNDLHNLEGLNTVKTQIDAAAMREVVGQSGDWPEPKPLPKDLPDVQPFNFDCLPETLRPWIEDISDRMQCPPDYPAVGAIIALGSLIGRKVGIRPKERDDWLVVPNLWGAVVGRPGLMKTPALEQALAPLKGLVKAAAANYEKQLLNHKISAMLEEQRAKVAEKAIRDLLKDGDEISARNLAVAHFNAGTNVPVLRRYVVNDSTVEKLAELLKENPNGLLYYRDELPGLLYSLEKEGREDSRAFILEAWNGTGEYTSDRIGRGTVRVEANTISILGGIQPGPLFEYLRHTIRSGVGDDGLLQRFQLAVWPDSSTEWRNVDRFPDDTARKMAFDVFHRLDALTPTMVGAEIGDGIPFIRFSLNAQAMFNDWRTGLEKVLRSDRHHPALEAHFAKYRKLVPALALILCLADGGAGSVTRTALGKSLLWAEYLESHARRIYSAAQRPDLVAARELGKKLETGALQKAFTLREIYRKGWTGLTSKEDAEAATDILCDLGWIRLVRGIAAENGRPPSPSFEVHPKFLKTTRDGTDKTDKSQPDEVLSVLSVASGQKSENSISQKVGPDLAEALEL